MQQDKMGIGSWTLIVALLVLLVAAVAFAYLSWTYEPGEPMPVWLLVPMTLGIVFSLIVGIGLMALVFYSSRQGYDEPTRDVDRVINRKTDRDEERR
jgi:RsiW-degrading membrane proteinase PrsW (M82 family)